MIKSSDYTSMIKNSFKKDFDLISRITKFEHIYDKEKIPCVILLDKSIIRCIKNFSGKPHYKANPSKYFSYGQLLHGIRKQLVDIGPEMGLFLYVDNKLPTMTSLLYQDYPLYKDPEDGFLYLHLYAENTFGCETKV